MKESVFLYVDISGTTLKCPLRRGVRLWEMEIWKKYCSVEMLAHGGGGEGTTDDYLRSR